MVGKVPRTQWISAHAPVLRNRIGVGFTGLTDRSGARGHREFMSHIAYHFPKPIKGFRPPTGLSLVSKATGLISAICKPMIQGTPSRGSIPRGGIQCRIRCDGVQRRILRYSVPHLIEQPMGFQVTGPSVATITSRQVMS